MNYRDAIYTEYLSAKGSNNNFSRHLNTRKPLFHHVIKKFFPKDTSANMVDLGCGSGTLVYFAKQAGYSNITGVDCSPEQIAAGKTNGLTNLIQSPIEEFLQQTPASSLDSIITFDVIEHLTKDELLILSKLIFKTLKKGGKWIIHTVNAESPFFGRIRYGDYTHEQAFTKDSLAQVFRVSGFSIFSCFEELPVIHNLTSFIRRGIWHCVRTFWLLCLMAETGEKKGLFSQNFFVIAEK